MINRKNGFTLIEVSILLVIFLIVAFLVAPLSLDDTTLAKNISKWKNVQTDFENIFYTVNTTRSDAKTGFSEALNSVLKNDIKEEIKSYKILYMNGTYPSDTYRFKDYNLTYSNAVVSIKLFDEPQGDLRGLLMYDVNGTKSPNIWGKDVFGLYIYNDRFEPFGKSESVSRQKQDCSKAGTGLSCSNYYLLGGNFD